MMVWSVFPHDNDDDDIETRRLYRSVVKIDTIEEQIYEKKKSSE